MCRTWKQFKRRKKSVRNTRNRRLPASRRIWLLVFLQSQNIPTPWIEWPIINVETTQTQKSLQRINYRKNSTQKRRSSRIWMQLRLQISSKKIDNSKSPQLCQQANFTKSFKHLEWLQQNKQIVEHARLAIYIRRTNITKEWAPRNLVSVCELLKTHCHPNQPQIGVHCRP